MIDESRKLIGQSIGPFRLAAPKEQEGSLPKSRRRSLLVTKTSALMEGSAPSEAGAAPYKLMRSGDEVTEGKICWALSVRAEGQPGDSLPTASGLVTLGTLPEAAPDGTETLHTFVVDEISKFGPACPDSIDRVEIRADVVRALCGDDSWDLLVSDAEELRITMTTFMTLSPIRPATNADLQAMFAAPPPGWHAGLPLTRELIESNPRVPVPGTHGTLADIRHSDTPSCQLVLIGPRREIGVKGSIQTVPVGGEMTVDYNARVVSQ